MLLEALGICKAFGGVPALRQAQLRLQAGEVHALIGQNGAGKSTLIKVLAGAYQADAGTLIWQGSARRFSSPRDAEVAGIATIHQEICLVPQRSVAENLFLGREPRRHGWMLDRKRMEQEAQTLMRRLGQEVDVRQPLASFPVATQQLAAIARALGSRARLVVMDEPTSSLDPREVDNLFAVIRSLKAEGVSVLLISHRLEELYAVCERITVMRDGQTVLEERMSTLSPTNLVATMLAQRLEQQLPLSPVVRQPLSEAEPLLCASGLATGPRLSDGHVALRVGEVHGLAGLLGSGRSELTRALFGADGLRAGRIECQGAKTPWREPADAIAAGLGLCTEDRKFDGIVPDASVRENLTLALLPRLVRFGVVDTRRQLAVAEQFIARLGIKCHSPEQPIRELSGGNQQKVLLARWLCMTPRLLILDEPTRGVDVGAKAEIQGLIESLAREQGLAVLLVSSEPQELLERCARVSVMANGRTVATLNREQLTEAALLTALAGG